MMLALFLGATPGRLREVANDNSHGENVEPLNNFLDTSEQHRDLVACASSTKCGLANRGRFLHKYIEENGFLKCHNSDKILAGNYLCTAGCALLFSCCPRICFACTLHRLRDLQYWFYGSVTGFSKNDKPDGR
jgi:hypothetical protein